MRNNYFLRKLQLAGLLLSVSLPVMSQTFENGIFILNEGGAGAGNASVSFLSNADTTLQNNIYGSANPNQGNLGDVGQSMTFYGNYAYLVMNMSNTVKIVDRYTFAYVATVSTGLNNPRYMAFANGKGYITNWGSGGNVSDDYIAILDLQTNTVSGTIAADEGVERIEAHGAKLYVAHQGGYGYGQSITVIDPETDTVEAEITVGDVPNSMVFKDNYLYVLCGGKPFWASSETDGSLLKIDLTTNNATLLAEFDGLHPANLEIDETDSIYFTSDEVVYKAGLSDPLAFEELFSLGAQGVYGIYGMDLIEGKLYVADAGNYVSPGKAYIYSTTGTQISVNTVGVVPNSFYKAEANLSIPPHEAVAIKVYPNPASGRFFLNANSAVSVVVYDQSGRKVISQEYTSAGIDVAALPTGLYIVQAIQNDRVSTVKLVLK